MDKWEKILWSGDPLEARKMNTKIDRLRVEGEANDWDAIAKVMGYPRANVIISLCYVNNHFLRAMNEIKLLAVFGNHTWQAYKEKE